MQVDLFAVQPHVSLEDYASADAFAAKHEALADRIDRARTPGRPALAVWPEMVGAFLPVVGAAAAVRGRATTDAAMRAIAVRSLPAVLGTAVRHRTTSLNRAFLTAAARRTWPIYWTTFSRIAARHDLWVVAGSALLPRNRYGDDSAAFAPLPGQAGTQVFNTSLTFAPDGRCVAGTRKVNLVPTQEDVLDLSAGAASELTVVPTPFGTLGTAICYDGFAEAHTAQEPGFTRCGPVLDALGATVVAQPSANAWAWDAPWFFNDAAAGEHQLRREQWFAEGFARELGSLRHVRHVVNPQLVGTILDSTFEAPSLILGREPDGSVVVLAEASTIDAEELLHVTVDVQQPVVEPALPAGRTLDRDR